jgi:hypothetical protein
MSRISRTDLRSHLLPDVSWALQHESRGLPLSPLQASAGGAKEGVNAGFGTELTGMHV